MLWKAVIVIAALAAPALAEEPSNCKRPAGLGYHNVTEINADGSFCTMLSPYGSQEVAPDEACANSYCFGGKYTNTTTHLVGPTDLILSVNYLENTTSQFTQITGCMDGSKWGLNPMDPGGQMDSHGWQYKCANSKKFVSLLEPSTNTYCIRCCNGPNFELDCDTAHSTHGCWNLVPGLYQMKDGSVCAPPAGAPNTTVPSASGSIVPSLPTGSASAPVGVPTGPSGAPGSTPTSGAGAKPSNSNTSAASRLSLETVGVAAAALLAIAASF